MREILFRGKRKDNGEWIYGYLHKMDGYGTGYTEYGIQQQCGTQRPWSTIVIPETIGQFTGLTDKNGRKIFEGDIVTYPESSCFGVVCLGGYEHFDSYHTGFFIEWFENDQHKGFRRDIRFWTMNQETWVVGNVHDNPELSDC